MKRQETQLLLGIDVGSTTAKAVLVRLHEGGASVEAATYCRHEARIAEAVKKVVSEVTAGVADAELAVLFTGSAGMGTAERAGLPFVQEVHAACALAALRHPEATALLDIGGEDSKLVFFEADGRLDARMNSGCAGGTGAFLDQMAALLSVSSADLEGLASAGTQVHPVASRCGVFAKTDVQNLLSLGVGKPDVALSVFHALATQVLASLARGRTPRSPLLMTGGPLTFLPTLRKVFLEKLHLEPQGLVLPDRGELACAQGAALSAREHGALVRVDELFRALDRAGQGAELAHGEKPLFESEAERQSWMAKRFTRVPRVPAEEAGEELFLGIDSGSTTTKLVLVDAQGMLVADHYEMNHGEPLEAARRGLESLQKALGQRPRTVRCSAATGYGEELLKAALNIELGLVETAAHLRAAQALAPGVSFVLDIGGQDMKALFVRGGQVDRIEVNEACSSGCGSFLQTFAENLSLSVQQMAEAACRARSPRALGSRCTVFMNSMVKQALREGAGLDEIAAGLSYSVARNCLQKVLKLRDLAPLGETIVVQGGTFLNPSVHRAFELLTGKQVICPDVAGLAGAWGAALWARDHAAESTSQGRPLSAFGAPKVSRKRNLRCKGCENTCPITLVDFEGAGRHVSGNRCERAFRNGHGAAQRGVNHMAAELELLLQRPLKPEGDAPRERIGLPLALGIYENMPFWASLLVNLGHEAVLSGVSDAPMINEAIDTFCSDSVCLPARIASAHVVRLGKLGVDKILFPQVVFEERQEGALTGFNCPIVTGYPEAVASAVPVERRAGVPVFTPPVSFRDPKSLRRTARMALEKAGIKAERFDDAFDRALADYERFREQRRELGLKAVAESRGKQRPLMMLACRPYHLDPYLHHGVPEMLADLGYDVLSCQCLPGEEPQLPKARVLPQWAYPNRILEAAAWVAGQPGMQLVQLNSFGCGPDAVVADEAASLLESKGKAYTLLRVDESTAPGSIRLRLRTLEMSAKAAAERGGYERRSTPPFLAKDRRRKLLTVPMDPMLFAAVGPEFRRFGYDLEVLPETDRESLELGLKYVNNEICYPAILTIGDLLKALVSGRYDPRDVALALSQTGGPCRASNYVPLLKKALVSAGFGEVPLVTLSMGGQLNEQPGFTMNKLSLLKVGLLTITVTDALSMMVRALGPRERTRGEAARTAQRLVGEWCAIERRDMRTALEFLDHAIREMAAVPVARTEVPRVGIVGEIYVKYSAYANRHLVDWLVSQGIEAVVPPLTTFFVQEPVNTLALRDAGIDGRTLVPWAAGLLDKGIAYYLEKLNHRLERFPYPVHFPLPRPLSEKASKVLSLTHQYGEGWVLGGEIMDMADRGISNVVCLQPFGCIANQVIGRGIERRLRAEHPELNVLFLDLDHNTSEANLFNRLKLLVTPPPRFARTIEPPTSANQPERKHRRVSSDRLEVV